MHISENVEAVHVLWQMYVTSRMVFLVLMRVLQFAMFIVVGLKRAEI